MSLGIAKAFKNIFRNSFMSFASVFSITSTLIILGVITSLIMNVNVLTQSFADMFNVVTYELTEDYDAGRIAELQPKLESIDNVKKVRFISREEAFEQIKKQFGENKDALEGLSKNPMTDSFRLEIKEVKKAPVVLEALEALDPNNTIYYAKEEVAKFIGIIDTIKNVGLVLISVFLITTIFVVHNTIRVSISSRRLEIEIMRYIGATRGFIRRPYIIEGIILGLLGALLSTGVIFLGYNELSLRILGSLKNTVNAPLLDTLYIIKRIGLLNVIIGIGVGIIGSIMSVRRYLKV